VQLRDLIGPAATVICAVMIRSDIQQSDKKIQQTYIDVTITKTDIQDVKSNLNIVKSDISNLKSDLTSTRNDLVNQIKLTRIMAGRSPFSFITDPSRAGAEVGIPTDCIKGGDKGCT